jgi:hypothetical protein
MAIHSFVKLMDETPLVASAEDINIDGGPLQATAVLSGQFELELPADPLQGTTSLSGNTEIHIMVYASPLVGHSQLHGQWSPGEALDLDGGALQATGRLSGSWSDGNSEADPLQATGILRGQCRIAPLEEIPYFHIELRDSSGVLQHVLRNNIEALQWVSEPLGGGCKSASFTIHDPPLSLEEDGLAEYDVRIMLDVGPGIDCWWRGYLLNPRLILGEPYRMEFSALGWVNRLETLPVIGLGFDIEDGGIRFDALDAAEIVRQLIDKANEAGAGLSYTSDTVPNSGFQVASIQFNSSVLDAIRNLAELAGEAEWGVDRRKNFYFLQSIDVVDRVFFIGKEILEMTHEFDHDGLINRLYLFGAEGKRWIIEDQDALTADVSHGTDTASINFGQATSKQRLVQTFTTTRTSLSAVDLKMASIGWGSNLVTDGEMELDDGSSPANWGKLTDRSRRKKVILNPHSGAQCLEIRHTLSGGSGRYGVYQDVAVTANQEVFFSCWLIDPHKEDPIAIDLVDGSAYPLSNSNVILESLKSTSKSGVWYRAKTSVTPTTTTLGLRIYARNQRGGSNKDRFYVDDVRILPASDLSISVVERTVETPLTFDEENPLAVGEIRFEDIPDTTPAVIRVSMIASPLSPAKTYGLLIESQGVLSDSEYFLLRYDSAITGLSKDDGGGWATVAGGAYHLTYLPSNQITYGIRSVMLDRPQIDNDEDALLYGTSFLAGRSTPIERGSVILRPNRNVLIEETQPVKLVRITRGK